MARAWRQRATVCGLPPYFFFFLGLLPKRVSWGVASRKNGGGYLTAASSWGWLTSQVTMEAQPTALKRQFEFRYRDRLERLSGSAQYGETMLVKLKECRIDCG